MAMFRMIAYAACLEGSDPVRLFDKRVNAKRGKLSYNPCRCRCFWMV